MKPDNTEYTEGASVAGPALLWTRVCNFRSALLVPDMPHMPARVRPSHHEAGKTRSAIWPAGSLVVA